MSEQNVAVFVRIVLPALIQAKVPCGDKSKAPFPEPITWTSEQRALADEIWKRFREEDR